MLAAVSRSTAIQPQPYAGPSVRSGGAAAGARTESTTASAASPSGASTDAAAMQAEVAGLQATDARVRAHEAAHRAAAGELARGGSYTWRTGPDGRAYVVGGEVGIDVSAVSGDPAATLAKMQQVQRAALAPVDPSPQDRRVAALAASRAQQARGELATGTTAAGDQASTDAADSAATQATAGAATSAATGVSASTGSGDPLAAAARRSGLSPALIERALAAYAAATQWPGFGGGLHLVA